MKILNTPEPKTEKQAYEERVRRACSLVPLEKVDPTQTALDQERIKRSLELVAHHVEEGGCRIADLGCGTGALTLALAERGCQVTALDASSHFLAQCLHPRVVCQQASLPYHKLPEQYFDGLVFTDVIASIEPHLHRLLVSELAYLMKGEGWLLCSTPLDLYSIDAPEQFIQLLETEFEVVASVMSYHRLHFYLSRWVQAPARFVRAGRDTAYRQKQLHKRSGLLKHWFALHSSRWSAPLWRPIALLLAPLSLFVRKSRPLLLWAERFSEALWGGGALTHMIVLARKKKIIYTR